MFRVVTFHSNMVFYRLGWYVRVCDAAYPTRAVTDRDVRDTYDFTGPVLGKGSFATVLRVRDSVSGSEYAIKQVQYLACG